MKIVKHGLAVLLALFLVLGLPFLHYYDLKNLLGDGGADAVSQATMVLPDQPSGNFVVFINRDLHPDSLAQWDAFFQEADYGVLLEDVHCMVISGDTEGVQLAERFQVRLVKDQMSVRQENGVLVASRMDHDLYDMVIASQEMADAWQMSSGAYPRAQTVTIQGGTP